MWVQTMSPSVFAILKVLFMYLTIFPCATNIHVFKC